MRRPKYLPMGFSKVLATADEIREWHETHKGSLPPRVVCLRCTRRMWSQGIGSHRKAGCAAPGSQPVRIDL